MESIVSKEQAELEFDSFARSLRLKVEKFNDSDKSEFEEIKKEIVSYIMDGFVIFEDDKMPIVNLEFPINEIKTIKFHRPNASMIQAIDTIKMDKTNNDKSATKTFAMMAEITRTTTGTFSKMDLCDFAVCQKVFSVFLGILK